MSYKRRESETELDYILRLVDGKSNGIYDIDYTELFNLAFDVELASDEARKRFYGLKMLLPYIDKEKMSGVGNEYLDELELKKQELIKEKYKIQTEKIALNQMLREQARFELFTEQAVTAIKQHGGRLEFMDNSVCVDCIGKSGLLVFADPHYGTEFKITGIDGRIINEYGTDIFKRRMWILLERAKRIIENEGFGRISVFNLGDEIDGILRISQLATLKKGVVDSSVDFAYFLSEWLNELSKHVSIDYYHTAGNHTDLRLLTGKKGDFPHENMSKIIQVIAKERLRDNKNIIMHENNADKIYTNIAGFNVLGIHGEERNVIQAIRDFSYIYGVDIDYLCTGHKHHANSANVGINKGCIGVGSIIGIDDFAMELKRVSNPTATFVIFEEGVGKVQEYTIYLD